jgi:Tfp pilus assembly protein PilO
MTLLRRIVREKRALVLPVAVALAGNAVLYAAAVMPLDRSAQRAAARAEAVAAALRDARQRFASAQGTVDGKRRADEDLRSFYKKVLPADWTTARRIAYVRLEELARKVNLRPARLGGEPHLDKESPLTQLAVTMVVAGDYADIREFIYEVESSPEFVVIDNVALAQGEETNAPLVLTIEVSTYYWARGDGS